MKLCSFPGCNNKFCAKNYCAKHYYSLLWNPNNEDKRRLIWKRSRLNRKDKIKKYDAEKYAANIEKYRAIGAIKRVENRDYYRAASAAWAKANPAKATAMTAKRTARKLQATPKWANFEKIQEFYITSDGLNMLLGERHHVDHIVPLQSKIVCGLHCEANLRVITQTLNLQKNNSSWPDMP